MAWANATSPPVIRRTAGGTEYEAVVIDPFAAGDLAFFYAPLHLAEGAKAVLVIANHGRFGSHATFENDAKSASFRDAILDAGWAFASPHAHGDTFGNATALADIRRVYDYANVRWLVTDALMYGQSMGGAAAFNATAHKVIPNLKATIGVAPSINFLWSNINSPTSSGAGIRSAYGVASNGGNFDTKTAGYDPTKHSPEQYTDARFAVWGSYADETTPKANMIDAFVAAGNTARMATFQLTEVTGGHLSQDHYRTAEMVDFYKAFVTGELAPAVPTTSTSRPVRPEFWDGAQWVTVQPQVLKESGWEPISFEVFTPGWDYAKA